METSIQTQTPVWAGREVTASLLVMELSDAAEYEKRFGAEAMRGKVAQWRELLADFAEKNSGQMLRPTQGPLGASFPSVWKAARVAITVQRAIRDQNLQLPEKARAFSAMALHQGQIRVSESGEPTGEPWLFAMRILSEAIPEEILISPAALPSLTTEFATFLAKELAIDGKPVRLQDVVWREDGKSIRVQSRTGAALGLALMALLGVGVVGAFLWSRHVHPDSNQPEQSASTVTPFIPKGPSKPADGASDNAAKPKPKPITGTLTLITLPSAKVMLGKQVLGNTPLFDVALPVGHHVLTLQGEDGLHRKLSVPIEAGKRASFKLQLDELPKAR